jgi:hypothetical protein
LQGPRLDAQCRLRMRTECAKSETRCAMVAVRGCYD